MKMDMFTNDNYKLLKLLHDNQTVVMDKKVVPLTQFEICGALSFSKMKVNAIFVLLQSEGYIHKITRGKYSLTDSAESIIKEVEKLNN